MEDWPNVDSGIKPKANEKICVTCRRALSTNSFSYFRSLSGRGSTLNDSCDQCAGILPPEVTRTTGYVRKSKLPVEVLSPVREGQMRNIRLTEEDCTSLLVAVVAWIATRNNADEKTIMGRLLVGPKPAYHRKHNDYGS